MFFMKAIIMAGGQGSRLRPLTCTIPKPLVRLCGRPIIEYILDLLNRHGITQAAVTLGYLSERITEHFPEKTIAASLWNLWRNPCRLVRPGSVRNACGEEDTEVLVISGDAMCDFNLAPPFGSSPERGGRHHCG